MTTTNKRVARTFAIGDVHGCADALQTVIAAIAPQPDDRVIMLGDYIDRGPASRQVIEQLLDLKPQCQLVTLKGNHEVLLLDSLKSIDKRLFWMQVGGDTTVESYGGQFEDIPPQHIEFMRSCLPYYETPQNIFVHANYDGSLPMMDQPDELLYWRHLSHSRPAPHFSKKVVFVGHTPQISGDVFDLDHIICIDTHCFGNGYLTAYNVDTGETIQADKMGELRPR